MGLDTIELVMAIERAFEIRLPEEQLVHARTVGELFDCIEGQLAPARATGERGPYTGERWEHYLDVLEAETGAQRSQLRPQASFVYDLGLY
jgi:hypothetical protein